MKSGGGVLAIATLQIIVGIILLGIYEGYKAHYFKAQRSEAAPGPAGSANEGINVLPTVTSFRSPMDFLFYLSIVNNVFSIFGLAGVLGGVKTLVTSFFIYNVVQMVSSFHYFIDLCSDVSIKLKGEPSGLTGYERAAAAFIFFNFLLSVLATVFATMAIEEIKQKRREEAQAEYSSV